MDTVLLTVKYYIIFPNGTETSETEKIVVYKYCNYDDVIKYHVLQYNKNNKGRIYLYEVKETEVLYRELKR